jgi:hypothetical protein
MDKIEIKLNETAVAIGAPIKPRRMGLGPHTSQSEVQDYISDPTCNDHLPRSQLRRALIGAAMKRMRVGTANKPGSRKIMNKESHPQWII